ncbi:MAG: UbiA family prenyltransferase [Candidatus Thermoplasmatota archaeon]
MNKESKDHEHKIDELLRKIDDKYIGKWYMKQPYNKTKILSIRARACIDLFRPFTLAAPFFVSMFIMIAGLVYTKGTLSPHWWTTVLIASFVMVITNAASNSLNQATDVESDKISKPHRPICQGILDVKTAQSLAYLLYLSAVLVAMLINIQFGILVFLIIIFTITYSLPPRMKRYLFLNQIWIAVPRGFLAVMASWSVFGNPLAPTPLLIGTIAMLFLIGGTPTKDIVDRKADEKTGTKTLINTLGIKKTAMISFPFMIIPFVIIPLLISHGTLKPYLWPLSFSVLFSILIFYLMFRKTENKMLENVHAWSIMYLEYIFFSMGFAILTIFGATYS